MTNKFIDQNAREKTDATSATNTLRDHLPRSIANGSKTTPPRKTGVGNDADVSSDGNGPITEPQASAAAKIGDNSRVRADTISFDHSLYLRHSHTEDDVARAKGIASQPALHNAIPVREHNGRLLGLDSSIFVASLLRSDPNAKVAIRIVSETEAIAIMARRVQQRAKEEPMVRARYALNRSCEGIAHENIAKELSLHISRISQMVSSAKAEKYLKGLLPFVENRPRIPVKFFEDVHTTIEVRSASDKKTASDATPQMDEFDNRIGKIIAAGEMTDIDTLRGKLGINNKRSKPKRRNRMIGKPVKYEGLNVELHVDRKRQGGRVINFPPGYSAENFDKALEALIAFLIEQEKGEGSAE
ncbi:hypothetical protein HME9302_02571 [Alteripontixanthobacter maritimus]|uniref:Uncharacterized protein n=1 Tax=Alteripontixanthobacter maritimus TaxID=2161824 RepID=A0A369QEL4_9SPHN|nr:hypothetical protein [Alteripontixanthobacter maritimus]RDC61349.1 hypothetical protein HME9302_02571 [Alteripontixanthobacter maritimus]